MYKDDNPAKNIINFSKHSNNLIREINIARTNPQAYLHKFQEILDIDDDEITITYQGYTTIINDGKEAILEAMEFLQDQPKLEPFAVVEGLSKSAEELLSFLILHDGMTSKDNDLSNRKYSLDYRINNYGDTLGELNEIIDYGNFNPEMLILGIIISDGEEVKREREILFSKKLKYIGVASNILPSDRVCTVFNFAERYFEKDEYIPQSLINKYSGKNTYKNTMESISRDMNKSEKKKEEVKPLAFERKSSSELYLKKRDFYTNQEKKGGIMKEKKKTKVPKKQESNFDPKNFEKECEEEILNPDIDEIKVFEKPMEDRSGNKYILVKKTYYYNDGTVKVVTNKN